MAYVEWGEVSKHPGDPYILIVRIPGYDTATYLSTPATRPIDAVRMELGKEASLALLTDSEITYNLGRANSNTLLPGRGLLCRVHSRPVRRVRG